MSYVGVNSGSGSYLGNQPITEGHLAGRRNLIINGGFDFWQRGTSLTYTGVGQAFLADRWKTYASAGVTLSQERFTLSTNPAYYIPGFQFAGHYQVTDAGSASDFSYLVYRAEEIFAGDEQKLTLSFWAWASDSPKDIEIQVGRYSGAGGSGGTSETKVVTIDSPTPKRYELTYDATSMDGVVLGADPNLYMLLYLSNGTGVIGSQTISLYLTGMQLEVGDKATNFDHRPVGEELALCQRYFCEVPYVYSSFYTTNQARLQMAWPTQMRVAPTITKTVDAGLVGDEYNYSNSKNLSFLYAGSTFPVGYLLDIKADAEIY